MLVRLMLVVSLTAQLALSYRCCGVSILRPDIVAGAKVARSECSALAVGACIESAECDSSCGEMPAVGCCDQSSCAPPSPHQQPCDPAPCEPALLCTPVDHKKAGPDALLLAPIELVAHPAIDRPIVAHALLPHPVAHLHPARSNSNQARQAWLSVWLN